MKISNIDSTIGGWFVGNFPNAAFQTDSCEVSYKFHKKGELWDLHYQEKITEVNLLIHGEMILQGKLLTPGTVFILYPYEIADPNFITDCEIVCVKLPGIVGDKVVVEKIKK